MQAFCKNCKFGGVVFKKMQQVPKIVERCYIYRKLGEVFLVGTITNGKGN